MKEVRFSRTAAGSMPVPVVLLLALMVLCAGGAPAASPQEGFPESLLDGTPDFNLAILLQGDVRGNFGPCG